jgi:hypothetical protein
MSLNVTAPTGLGENAEAKFHAACESLDEVIVEVLKEGFPPVTRPNYAPPLLDPSWLDNLTPERYHLMMAQLDAWKTYAHSLLNIIDGGVEETDTEMKLLVPAIKQAVRAQAQASNAPKPAEKAIDDMVLTNPRYQELVLRRQRLVQKRKLVEPHYERYGRNLRQLSRSLEMRRQELEHTGTGDARGPRKRSF